MSMMVDKVVSLYQAKLRKILDLSVSHKVVDKKKCIPELMKFLDDAAAVEEVDKNTIEENSFPTWDQLLNAIHNFLVVEMQNAGGINPPDRANIKRICSSFLSVVYHSHKRPRMLVTPRDMVSYVIQILGNDNYQICHGTYMSVLSTYVLSHDYYYARISQEQWEELWKICVVDNRNVKENPENTINVIHKLVKLCCVHSQFHSEVKKILPVLEDIFERVKNESYPSLFALFNSVMQHIGKDCRMLMCDFTERILGHLKNFEFFEIESYRFLLFALTIHHPKGIYKDNDSAYASDWDQWNGILRFLYTAILKNLNNTSNEFLDFACEVFHQVIHMKDVENIPTSRDNDSSRAMKRRRLSFNKYKLADLIPLNNYRYSWGVIRITIRLLDKYPTSLNADDIVPFVKEMVVLLKKITVDYELIAELNVVLGKIEPNLAKVDAKIPEIFSIYWEDVNDLGFRSLKSLGNQKPGVLLLRSLINVQKLRKFKNLIGVFTFNTIKPSISGIFMLASLLDDIFLLTNEAKQKFVLSSYAPLIEKKELFEWTLNVFHANEKLEDLPFSGMIRVILGLVLKPWHKNFDEKHDYGKIINRKRSTAQTDFLNFLKEIEECYLALNINSSLLVDQDQIEERSEPIETKNVKILYDEEVGNALIEHLEKLMKNLMKEKRLQGLISIATLVGKLATGLSELSIMIDKEQRLFDLIRESLTSAMKLLNEKHFFSSKHPFKLYSRLKSLILLYETSYTEQVSEIIVSETTPEMISILLDLLKSANRKETVNDLPSVSSSSSLSPLSSCSYRRDFQRNLFEDTKQPEDAIKIYVVKVLSAFYSKPIGMEMLEIQRSALSKLFVIENFVFSNQIDVEAVIQSLNRTFANSIEIHYPKEAIEQLENFLSKFYEHSYRSEEIARYLLTVLPKALKLSWYSKEDVRKLLKIILRIRQRLKEKHYGPHAYHEYIDFLCVIRTDLSIDLQYRLQVENEKPIIDDILDCVASPFYSVRLSTLKCLIIVFTGEKDSEWLRIFFKRLKKVVRASFRVDGDLGEKEMQDERMVRISSGVHIFTLVARVNDLLQKNALVALLKLAEKLSLDVKVIQKLLKFIAEGREKGNSVDLVREHLNYLIRCWFTQETTLQDFPWILTGSESEEGFFKTYCETIVPVFLENQKFDMVVRICETLNIPFSEVTEKCFAEIFSWLLCNVQLETGGSGYAAEALKNLEKNEKEFATMRPFATVLREKLEDVMMFLVKRLNDKNHFEGLFDPKVAFPDSNWPDYSTEIIRASLNYLTNYISSRQVGSLLESLSHDRPSTLQKVLLGLACDIYRFKYTIYNLKAFHRYAFFCEVVSHELLRNGSTFAMSAYVVRDISYTLLHLVKENTEGLSEIACKYFHTFLMKILPEKSADFEDTLNFTVSSFSSQDPTKIPSVAAILRLLIQKQGDAMQSAVKGLDPFPNDPRFDDIRKFFSGQSTGEHGNSLKSVIETFLNSMRGKNTKFDLQDIIHLRKQLSVRQEEIEETYRKFHTLRGFVEDCLSSFLHRLIYTLIKLADNKDDDVSLEALKCLGELGPADITTTIIHPDENDKKENIPAEDALSCKIILYLFDCLMDPDVYLRRAASDSLYAVLESPWGLKLLNAKYMKIVQNALGDELETDSKPEASRMKYLYPFIARTGPKDRKPFKIDWANLEDCFDAKRHDFWSGLPKNSHSKWIANLTSALASCFVSFYSKSLIPVCHLDVRFCQLILPRMFYLLLDTDKRTAEYICRCINAFFQHYCDNSKQNATACEDLAANEKSRCSQETVRWMINVVNFLRVQSGSHRWPFNYMYIAKAAQYCSAYFTSIFYGELYINLALENQNCSVPQNCLSKIEHIYQMDSVEGKELQNILRESYVKIEDPDGIYGCGSSYLDDAPARVQYYTHTNQWNKILLVQDIQMCLGRCTSNEIIVALQNCNLQHILGRYISHESKQLEPSMLYEAAWRLSDWTVLDKGPNLPEDAKSRYHHFQALKSFDHQRDVRVFAEISNSRRGVASEFRNIFMESTTTIYGCLARLQMLRELEEMIVAKPDNYAKVLSKCQKRDTANCNSFRYVEPIITHRLLIYKMVDHSYSHGLLRTAITNNYLTTVRISISQGYPQMATTALATLSRNHILLHESVDEVRYEEARMVWIKNYEDLAKYKMQKLMSKSTLDLRLRSKALHAYGNWMAEAKCGNPRSNIDKYYITSIDISKSIEKKSEADIKHLHELYVTLAQYAEAQYQEITQFMQSQNYRVLMNCLEYSREFLKNTPISSDPDVRRAITICEREVALDTEELGNVAREKDRYMLLAFQYYLKALCVTEDYNLLIFRVANMFMDHKDNVKLTQLLNKALDYLSPHKFVPLVPQLAPHMSYHGNHFTDTVRRMLKMCALQHPHHTLPILLALNNLHGDCEFDKDGIPRDKEEPRVTGAKRFLSELTDSKIGKIIEEMQKLSHALVMFANTEVECRRVSTFKIPSNQEILSIRSLENILLPTISLDVNLHGNYDRLIGIHKYKDYYETVGGINTPKKMFCIGTDGICRKQLLKGKDDLRQDAVMQQVFGVMNGLLGDCKETKKRKLCLRTYKVVPLTERSGILEWCENTIPIVKILTDEKEGMHVKYFPNDLKAMDCRLKMRNAAKKPFDVKLKVYLECCKRFNPAFHYYFTEKYPSPAVWYEKKLAYTRSVATTSIVGYILGLGDRHLSNILMDQSTAEVIHIDFGVAFDQGKVLPIPEVIPFRLTRDIEVAMGVSGVEGTMKRCCEETMEVLRRQKDTILTLLQVLLYDPLYIWSITPALVCKIQGKQGNSTTSKENEDTIRKYVFSPEFHEGAVKMNKLAQRALIRLEQKLQGMERGYIKSVGGQVESLIQEARDPSNLCCIYEGWQPFL